MRVFSSETTLRREETHYGGLGERRCGGMLLLLVRLTFGMVCGDGMLDELDEVVRRLGDRWHVDLGLRGRRKHGPCGGRVAVERRQWAEYEA